MSDLVEIVRRAIDEAFDLSDQNSQATAAIAAIEKAGHRIVPVEPTDLMAVSAVNDFDQMGVDVDRAIVRSAWAAMLAAAPKVTP